MRHRALASLVCPREIVQIVRRGRAHSDFPSIWRLFLLAHDGCILKVYATEHLRASSMTYPRRVPIFDGHNDVLSRLHRRGGRDAPRAFLEGEGKGQLDLPMAQQGGFAGGLFAIFVPSTDGASDPRRNASVGTPDWRLPSNWARRKGLYSA